VLESVHNNGKGIKVALRFTPLLPPPKAGTKRHKNAKAPVENCILWLHEEDNISHLLDAAIDSVGRADKLTYSIANRSGLVDSINFSIKYTIPHSNSKDIPLSYVSDFTRLVDEVSAMKNVGFRLFIFEHKVRIHLGCQIMFYC
jgi:hypothetical protein